jgi:hypothetical protein
MCAAGDWTYGLQHARQVLYHLSVSPALALVLLSTKTSFSPPPNNKMATNQGRALVLITALQGKRRYLSPNVPISPCHIALGTHIGKTMVTKGVRV